jgi:hypothetical protein
MRKIIIGTEQGIHGRLPIGPVGHMQADLTRHPTSPAASKVVSQAAAQAGCRLWQLAAHTLAAV